MVMVSLAVFEPSVPVIVMELPDGGSAGAVYSPDDAPIVPGLPPVDEATVQTVCTSFTPFKTEENCTVPPEATLAIVGLMEYPSVTATVTVAVFEVTVFELVLLLLVVVFVCCATAVMLTCPLLVDGTTVGAV